MGQVKALPKLVNSVCVVSYNLRMGSGLSLLSFGSGDDNNKACDDLVVVVVMVVVEGEGFPFSLGRSDGFGTSLGCSRAFSVSSCFLVLIDL